MTVAPFRRSSGVLMCDKCAELDRKIGRYRQILERVLDAQVTEGVGKLIEAAEAEKAALHR
jgi:hypothetical protein